MPFGSKPIEQWAPLVLEAAKAMKKADSRIQLTAAALPTREWTLPLLKMAGPYLDYISIHSYWLPLWGRNDMPDYLTCILHSESPEKMIGDYIGVLEEAGYRGRIKIAFDEWNLRGWHHPGFPRKTVQDYNDPEVKRFEPGSPLADEKGFRRDVLAALKELKVPIVRWPGGCFVSGYHWQAGVGKERKPTDDMAWGEVEPNTFGTDEYVELCRTLGWTPYICNNAGNGTIEEMRNWVEYCNGNTGRFAQMRKDNGYSEPRNVPIWSVGNENWGQHEIGSKPNGA